ncbi:TonB-dependent receptor [Alteraurantiacibacter aestuarii]|uniref:TonB-dependent receptor plug domain-containing protein n=1 Tax=Alteraurantiacibacter aestuarii TaxID=650004 RepID=A0A844ZSZ1_9SPHN|nr:TonB-dependent receptor plug domain-containing protein [Alteraurantiacibacter aestuarii]MXO88699.1 TonB-dependent receptor plug domain-containing protein [Alteraurantiacibacter aestuarii]
MFTRSHTSILALVASQGLLLAPAVQAQDVQAVTLPEIIAEGDGVGESYTINSGADDTGVDSGTSIIGEDEIEDRTPGSGDVNQLLKILPTVQFTREEGLASPDDIIDLRPANISISGGRIYENLITIDGMDVNSRLDITNDNVYNANEPAGNSAQTIWLDSSLIGEIILRDSNISAEYGSFTGGALEITTRTPRRYLAAEAYGFYTGDGITGFNVSDATLAAFGDDPLPVSPQFHQWRFGGSVDMPLSQDVAILLAAGRKIAEVTSYRHPNYGGGSYTESSTSDNYLASIVADLSDDMTLRAKAAYSPYETMNSRNNALGLDVLTKGGGFTGEIELANRGDLNWEVVAAYTHSNSGRESSTPGYSIPSNTTFGGVCSSSTCSLGGNGNLDQTQDNYALSFNASSQIGAGTLRGGFGYERVDAFRSRPEDQYSYSRGDTVADLPGSYGVTGTIICQDTTANTCADGEYALGQYNFGKQYDVAVGLDKLFAWAEYSLSAGAFDLRGGLRYDYESFLGNHDFAPRLAASWNLPLEGWVLTAGANRYYGKSMLAYAIREAYPRTILYRREGTVVGNDVVFADSDWTLYRETQPASYGQADLDTPYSDELTAALTGTVLGGQVRLKGIYRRGKDEFASSPSELVTVDTATGTSLYRSYTITNDGRSTYKGISLEWLRSLGTRHSLALNMNYSTTRSNNADYFETSDDEEFGEDIFLYHGDLISGLEIKQMNRRLDYAAPFIANATWTALWLDDRVTTNLNFRYRTGFDQIEDTTVNQTVDGVRYDVYDDVRYRDNFDVNLNVQVEVIRSQFGSLTADLRLENMLNRIPSKEHVSISYPYQYGRQAWLGLRYNF